MATAWQAKKHEIWECLSNAAESAVFSGFQRLQFTGSCVKASAFYGVMSTDAGISLKPQLEEAEAKPALEPIARRPAPLEVEAPQPPWRFSCSF